MGKLTRKITSQARPPTHRQRRHSMAELTQRVAITRRWIAHQIEAWQPVTATDFTHVTRALLLIADDQIKWLDEMAYLQRLERVLARLAPHIPELQEESK
jgi:hypothetical protein